MLQVSAGAIFRSDGRVLLCQRGYGDCAGLWEFPGGKREPGEDACACLEREIREELIRATRRKRWNEMLLFQQESELLLDATLDMDGEAVAERIEKIHEEYASTIQYNNENSLSSVLALAYLSAMQYYFKPVRELPTGRGFADFVFIPKPEYKSDYPALVVELKWNKSAVSALQQIKDRKYPDSIQDYTGDILLVGINYSKKDKKHECVIKAYKKK